MKLSTQQVSEQLGVNQQRVRALAAEYVSSSGRFGLKGEKVGDTWVFETRDVANFEARRQRRRGPRSRSAVVVAEPVQP